MQRFHLIDEGAAILRLKGGTYRQAKVYVRGKDVFAAVSGGFVRLLARAGTTNPNVGWLDIEADGVSITSAGVPAFLNGDS